MKNFILSICLVLLSYNCFSSYILIPMDDTQKNHLKAYGIAYWSLKGELEIQWLTNYRGGSFMIPNSASCWEILERMGATPLSLATLDMFSKAVTLVSSR